MRPYNTKSSNAMYIYFLINYTQTILIVIIFLYHRKWANYTGVLPKYKQLITSINTI